MRTKNRKTNPEAISRYNRMSSPTESPTFVALLDAGRASEAMPLEELDKRLGPLTDVEKAQAAAHLRAIDRLGAEQDSEIDEEQDRLVELVLAAGMIARGQASVEQLARDTGWSEAALRATAVALEIVGLAKRSRSAR